MRLITTVLFMVSLFSGAAMAACDCGDKDSNGTDNSTTNTTVPAAPTTTDSSQGQ